MNNPELTSFEISKIVKELGTMEHGRLDKAFQISQSEYVLQFYVANTGQRFVRLLLPGLLFIVDKKPSVPDRPGDFTMMLRRQLRNSRLEKVSQHGFERVVVFSFSTKAGSKQMVLELFGTGNIILLDDKKIILAVLSHKTWQRGEIRKGRPYSFPEGSTDPFQLSSSELAGHISRSGQDSLVKALAVDLSMGGRFAEELVAITGLAKTLKPSELAAANVKALKAALDKLANAALKPCIVAGQALPFPLQSVKGDSKSFPTFSEALAELTPSLAVERRQAESIKKQSKAHTIIRAQTEQLRQLENAVAENSTKAELIYKNYPYLAEAMRQLHEARKTLTWQEIKKRIRDKRLVQINETEGKVIFELE